MNKTFRNIWNESTGAWVAVPETVKARGKRASGAVLLAASGLGLSLAGPAQAQTLPPAPQQLPTGGQVVGGSATISQSGSAMTVQQATQRAALDWQTFNIGKDASVHFAQPTGGVALNRVSDPNPSQIFGRLTATGQVFLSNPSGVYFAPGASVDVGGLVATTHGISVDDFLAGGTRFERNGATGSVINAGELKAQLGGYIALLAPEVRNEGVILASAGTVALAAGEAFELKFDSNNTLAGLRVTPATLHTLVDNRSAVLAPGGLVILSARAVNALQGSVVNSGDVSASSLVSKGGRILLEGDDITLRAGSTLTATGATGGGEVLVGGDWQGGANAERRVLDPSHAMHQATTVTMEQGASIDVSATNVGAGGTAVLWSEVGKAQSATTFAGRIVATGGANGGNGGKVETSGHSLWVGEGARVDTLAAQGKAGEWLLDPVDFTISAGTAAQTTSGIGATTLSNALNTGNVVIATDASTGGAGDITVASNITKTAASGTTTLTLKAHRSVVMNGGVSINGAAAAPLNVVLWADADSSGGGGVLLRAVDTKGGHLYVGGGSASTAWNGLTVPNGGATSYGGFAPIFWAGNLTTGGGQAFIWSGGTGTDAAGQLTSSGANTINAGTGSITIRANNINLATAPVIQTTGAFSFLPNSISFARDVAPSEFTYGANLGGFTFGASGNTSNITFNNALSVAGPISLYGNSVTLNQGLTTTNASTGDIGIEAAGLFGAGNISLANTRSLTVNQSGNSIYSGVISGASASLSKGGAGRLSLLGNNTYSGGTSLNAGGLGVYHNSALGTGTLTLSGGTELLIGRAVTTLANDIVLNGAATIDLDSTVEYLVVGGGGGGGNAYDEGPGGGGGAGGMLTGTTSLAGGAATTVTVGAGGAGGAAVQSTDSGASGGDSALGAITAVGGGGGGGSRAAGVAGGSGGGAGGRPVADGGRTGGAGTPGQGNSGGNNAAFNGGGGGGGAGGAGADGTASAGGAGGAGLAADISGSSVIYAVGGSGGRDDANGSGAAGTANRGHGGAGASDSASSAADAYAGGAGGSGIVVARYVGGTAGTGGTITTGSGTAAGYAVHTFTGSGALALNALNPVLSGTISGTGALTANATDGSITFTGANTFSGGSTISGGVVKIGNAGNSGTLGAGNIVNNASLQFNRSDNFTLANVISGTGDLTKLQASIATLTGSNSYSGTTTVSGGTLQIGAGGTTGTLGGGGVTNNSALVFNRADDVTVSNLISGTGSLTQAGAGTLTLTQNNDYSGANTISNGTLVLSNDAPNPINKSFGGTGSLRIESASASFGSDFDTTGWTFGNTLGGLSLGKPGNARHVTVAGATSIAGPISLYGGNIAINAALTATGASTISLSGSGTITQTAGLTADKLSLLGGNVILDNTSNNVATLAASGVSGLTYVDGNALTVGVVNATGISATGQVRIETLSGDLSVAQNIATTDTSVNAVVLNAGKSTAAGTATGGNILVTSGKAVTVGTGGTARLYSGSISDSTGLTDLVGPGSGRFRYGSDEADTNYTTVLATGLNAIYRERPTVSISSMTLGMTYGDALPNVTATGAVNGDESSYSITNRADSTSGQLKAGAYSIDSNLGGLGYTVTGASSGTLTVNKLALAGSIAAGSSVYGAALTPGGATLTNKVGTDELTPTVSVNTAGNTSTSGNLKAGTYTGIQSISALAGADADNYSFTSISGDYSVSPLALAGSIAAGSSVYGSALAPGAITWTNRVGTDELTPTVSINIAGNTSTSGNLKAGSYTGIQSVSALAGADAGNYTFSGISGDYNVSRLSLNLAGSTGLAKTYDGTTNLPSGVLGYGSLSGVISSDAVDVSGAPVFDAANASTARTVLVGSLALSGAQAGNYNLNWTNGSGTINPATLNVSANNDARFYKQTDTAGYAGVSYSGFVNGETASVLNTGGLAITRSGLNGDGSNDNAGSYALTASGITANNGNYSLNYQTGTYTIVPAGQLLVKVGNQSVSYGATPSYTVVSAQYLRPDNTTIADALVTPGSGASFTAEGVGFDIAALGASQSTAGKIKVGSYQTSGTVTSGSSSNFNNNLVVVGALTVTQKALAPSASAGISKTYDGTTAMTGVSIGLAGKEANDVVTVSGNGAFSDKHAADGKEYTISCLALGGADAANYYITGGGSFTGNDGVILKKQVTLTPQDASRSYNGSASYTPSAADLGHLSNLLGVSGDSIGAATLSFDSKNVGTRTLTLTSVAVSDGNDGNNYAITLGSNSTSSITRLSSVEWIGPAQGGNWFDPANWAGGAVPDLSNVANVVIPAGKAVTFDIGGAVSPADASAAVNIESLGTAGSLTQTNGTLNVGNGGITLGGLTQNGGTLTSSGDVTLGHFTQTSGSTTTTHGGNFTVNESFGQAGSGSVTVNGNTRITDTSGGLDLGNLTSNGKLDVTSSGGAIKQAGDTAIIANGESTFAASSGGTAAADILLDNTGNDFKGTVNVSRGGAVKVVDGNALVLGNINITGNLTVNADGNVTQSRGTAINLGGTGTINSSGGTVSVPAGRPNHFGGGLTVTPSPSPAPATPPAPLPARGLASFGTSGVTVGLSLDVLRTPGTAETGLIAVSVPRGTATSGAGFSFSLPSLLTDGLPPGTTVQVTLAGGLPLPAWLRFDVANNVLVASAVPDRAFPVQLVVTIGSRQTTLVISERNE